MSRNSVEALRERYGDWWRWLAVLTVMLGTMATVLSATVINVALPDIMSEFGIRQGTAHWLATGYIAAMTTTMLTSTWLLEHFGVRKTLGIAMLAFSAISIAGGFSPNADVLISARVAQGAIAGLMQPMAMYLVFRIFPRERRGQAMGIYGMGVILAPALGPVLGGFLVDQLDWRYVLFAPAPVTLVGVFMAWKFLPLPVSRPAPYPFDLLGLLLLGSTLASALDVLNRLQRASAQPAWIALEALLVIVLFILFIYRQRRASHPLLRLGLMQRQSFRYANIGALVLGLALYGSTYLIPLFVQTALNFSATDAGLLMLPAGIVLGVLFPVAGRLADHFSPHWLAAIGCGVFALSAVLFAVSGQTMAFAWLVMWAIVGRVGLAFILPALSMAALNPLEPEELGAGSSVINFTRQLGGAFGINILALTLEYGEHANGVPTLSAFHTAWWVIALIVVMALVPIVRMRD